MGGGKHKDGTQRLCRRSGRAVVLSVLMSLASFNVYHSYLECLEPLCDAERGRLFTALLQYSISGDTQALKGNERYVFPFMRSQIDRDKAAYEEKCVQHSKNGRKGALAKIKADELRAAERLKAQSAPQLKDIEDYCKQLCLHVNPQAFYDYYQVANWTDSCGRKVINWKQKLLTWENNGLSKAEQRDVREEKSTGMSLADLEELKRGINLI